MRDKMPNDTTTAVHVRLLVMILLHHIYGFALFSCVTLVWSAHLSYFLYIFHVTVACYGCSCSVLGFYVHFLFCLRSILPAYKPPPEEKLVK